ncbi:hypothetical protein [Oceanobacillus massiliensis]|uniref:hypothetical protein n=1 Tax=Oceanobacillus massiliensis TaxID=1465765 RepID=UPI003015E00E
MVATYIFLGVTGAILITSGALDAKVNQVAINNTLDFLKIGGAAYLLWEIGKRFYL